MHNLRHHVTENLAVLSHKKLLGLSSPIPPTHGKAWLRLLLRARWCLQRWEIFMLDADDVGFWLLLKSRHQFCFLTLMVFPVQVLNGNVVIETQFFDGDLLVSTSKVQQHPYIVLTLVQNESTKHKLLVNTRRQQIKHSRKLCFRFASTTFENCRCFPGST